MTFPFSAIVGNANAKLAFMLLAVDGNLRGLLFSSLQGAAKTTLARSAQSIFAEASAEGDLAIPFVELPLGLTQDRLLGGLDFERTMRSGKIEYAKGLLVEADGGAIFADDFHLFDKNIMNQIAATLDSKVVTNQGEDLEQATGADFVFIGACNVRAGDGVSLLRERVGLLVGSEEIGSIDDRAEIASRVVDFQKDREKFRKSYEAQMQAIKNCIAEAKRRLPLVKISFEDLQRISAVAIRLGVEGNAADIFAMRCAKAHAALMKREAVGEEDLIKAIQFVLLPRAAQIPDRVELAPIDKTSQAQKKSEKDPSSSALPDDNPSQKIDGANQSANLDEQKRQPQNQQQEQRREDNSQSKELQPQGVAVKPIEELIIQALAAQLPDGAMQSQIAKLPASEKAATGKRAEVSGGNRGRFARHSAKKTADKKIAFAATLRAASPFQNSRKSKDQSSTPTVKITAEDLRYKKFKKKSGMLFIFAVDASGSMALNRMAQAKGAMTRLLQEAYIHRDKVSLISFRKEVAAILLPPTRSVELAKRVVDAVATGGTTPIAAALMQALRLAKSARSREISQTMLVMFTDGRANVGVGVAKDLPRDEREKAITRELRELGAALLSAGIAALVIDTKPKFVNAGDALELAETIGAKYLYMPRADDKTIYQTLAKTVKR